MSVPITHAKKVTHTQSLPLSLPDPFSLQNPKRKLKISSESFGSCSHGLHTIYLHHPSLSFTEIEISDDSVSTSS